MKLASLFVDVVPRLDMSALNRTVTRASNSSVSMSLDVDTKQAKRQIASLASSSEVDRAGKGAGKKFGGALAVGLKTVLTGGALLAGVGAVVGGAVVSAASDAQQSVGATQTVFGKYAKTVGKSSQDAAKKVGLSGNAYRENANLIASLLKNQGVAQDQLAGKTDNLITKAADLSATFGGSTTESVQALSSALKGEFDPLERYGISLKQSTVSAEAYRIANVNSASEFGKLSDAQQKSAQQQATLALINKQSADSSGAFAKETDTLAHQQQVLSAQFDNLKVTLGNALLPVLTRVLTFLNDNMVPAFETVRDAVGPVIDRVKSFFTELTAGTGQASGAFGIIQTAATTAGPLITGAFAGIISFVQTQFIPAFAGIVSAVQGYLGAVTPIVTTVISTVVGVFRANLPVIQGIWTSVKEIIVGVMGIIQAVISQVTRAISFIWATFGNQIIGIIKTAWTTIINIVGGALKIVSGVIKLVLALIKGDWSGAWNAIKQIVDGAWQVIKAIVSGAIGFIKNILAAAWIVIRGAVSAAWAAISGVISSAWNGIKSTFNNGVSAVKGTWNAFWGVIKSTASTAINAVKVTIDTVLGKIKGAFETAKTNIGKVWDGIKEKAQAPINWIKDNVYNKPLVPVWNRIAGLVNGPKLQAYAEGGVHTPYGVRPGYTPGRDTHLIAVGGGEGILRPEAVRAMGAGTINALNAAARSGGGIRKVQELLGHGAVRGYAGGGVVDWLRDKVGGAVNGGINIAKQVKDWALGGLKAAASKILQPVRDGISKAMPAGGIGQTVAAIGTKAIDGILTKIGLSDQAKVAETASPGDPGGPAMGGGSNRVTWKGGTFTERFRNTLIRAQRLAGVSIPVIQGGFSRRVAISGTSHYGDAIDTQWNSSILSGLRKARVAAWHRTPAQGFSHHIHGVPLPGAGYPGGSGIWQAQDYLRGGNGLAAGGIIRGGRGGVHAWMGEGKNDELVTPLPANWSVEKQDDTMQQILAALKGNGGLGANRAPLIASAVIRETVQLEQFTRQQDFYDRQDYVG